jgi:hypothetical protein
MGLIERREDFRQSKTPRRVCASRSSKKIGEFMSRVLEKKKIELILESFPK